MHASTVRLVTAFALLFLVAVATHAIGPGPDGPAPTSHRAAVHR
ncbi:hypothetical protein ABEG17_14535 [Pedococcus sp. KACC 23699]|uniref:Uncharacterized protein n=1 Tax=Pedococcus sp. KACC 23699 TaxID=3149228 RepID=A0AAU7JRC0_9MICO